MLQTRESALGVDCNHDLELHFGSTIAARLEISVRILGTPFVSCQCMKSRSEGESSLSCLVKVKREVGT